MLHLEYCFTFNAMKTAGIAAHSCIILETGTWLESTVLHVFKALRGTGVNHFFFGYGNYFCSFWERGKEHVSLFPLFLLS